MQFPSKAGRAPGTALDSRSACPAHVVLDRGIGIDADAGDRLFEPFYRTETARGAATGLGIGLALCQRIVTALGGRISAMPRAGGGAEAAFVLPIAGEDDDLR